MENESVTTPKVKTKKKWYLKLLIFIGIIGIIILILGFVFPGLLWAKNLGIKYTKADYTSILNKLDYVKDETPTGNSIEDYEYKYEGLKDVEIEFTSEELTAFFNEDRPSYFPVKNVQIKINNDGTIEASGTADVDYFLNNVLSEKYSREQIKEEIPALGILPSKVNLYLKVSGSIEDNKSTLNMQNVSVQGIPLPSTIYDTNEAINTVSSGIDKLMSDFNSKTGSDFYKIFVENGKIKFNAKIISLLERTKK